MSTVVTIPPASGTSGPSPNTTMPRAREKLVLWRHPVKTVYYFLLELVYEATKLLYR